MSIAFLLFCATPAFAATLSFDPQEHTVGLATPFEVAVVLDATAPVNTVSVSMTLPPNLTPADVSDGNSIINFWVDKPTYDQASRTLTFSGIIPGGYTGTGGRLLLLKLTASAPGDTVLTADLARSVAYLNTPDATADTLSVRPLTLAISAEKNNVPNVIPDHTPPEAFSPTLVRLPDALGREQTAVVFATQDKGSGMDRYVLRETSSDAWFPDEEGWQTVQSPYLLQDQTLRSTIEIRAIDKEGNVRLETIVAPYPAPWYATGTFTALVLALCLLAAAVFAILKTRTTSRL